MQNQQDAYDGDSLSLPDGNPNEQFDLSNWIRAEYLQDTPGTSVEASSDDVFLNCRLQLRVRTKTPMTSEVRPS